MAEEQAKRGLSWWMWVVILGPVAYALSGGPAALYDAQTGGRHRQQLRAAYAPLIWLQENTPARAAIDLYIQLWGGR
jgi:hypothetical protein